MSLGGFDSRRRLVSEIKSLADRLLVGGIRACFSGDQPGRLQEFRGSCPVGSASGRLHLPPGNLLNTEV